MAKSSDNGRSPIAVGLQWATRITSVSMMVVIPTGIGWWCDQRWGTSPWLLLTGVAVGLATGALSFLQIVKELEREE